MWWLRLHLSNWQILITFNVWTCVWIHSIEGDASKLKIEPQKIKQPDLDVLKYIRVGKYPEVEVGKWVYAVREGQYCKGRQYIQIQIYVAHGVTWDNWYTTLRGQWKKKVENCLQICNLIYAEPLWFGWLVRSTWQMDLTNDFCKVHKRRSGVSLGINPKRCADGRKWSKH